MKRVLSTIILMSMLATLTASCGDTSDDTSDSSADTTSAITDPVETGIPLDLPEDLKYEGKTITILTAEGILQSEDELTEDMDVLQQAMFKRTSAVEERFGIDLEFIPVNPWTDAAGLIRQSVNSQSDDYQLAFTCATHMTSLINEGMFTSLNDLPYIDIEKPWWNKEYIESVSLHEDDQYILFGHITYNNLQRTTCVFFNANLLENKLNMKAQDLYDLVNDGKWTIDKFTELVSAVYEDDGNTVNDADDIHGLIYLDTAPYNWMAFSSGLDFTTRDEDGFPQFNLNNENSVALVDKLLKLFINNDATFSANSTDNRNEFVIKFGEGKALFMVNRLYLAGWTSMREMEDDYGILPMPKFSEDIEGYHCTVEELVQWGGVPVTVTDPTMVSAVAEALAYESYMLTTPAYYETTLKLKLTRDEASMEMIDLIMESRDTDYLFINSLGGLKDVFLSSYNNGQNIFASSYAAVETWGIQALQKLINNYKSK